MKIVKIFLGADMRCMHIGLIDTAESNGQAIDKLQAGEVVVFVNRKKNRIKTMSANGVMAYYNLSLVGRELNLEALAQIPKAFDANGKLNFKRNKMLLTFEKKITVKSFEQLEKI